jgi:predicted transcriptional regulator
MTNYEKFIVLCNKFTRYLSDTYQLKSNATMGQVIRILRHRHPLIKYHFEALDSYADLRNVLVHETYNEHVLAQPSDHVIKHFEWIYQSILTPISLRDLMHKTVISLKASMTFSDVLDHIRVYKFSHYPIFEKNHFLGVLSDNGIAHALAQKEFNEMKKLYQTPLKQILDFDEHKNDYLVVSIETSMFDLFETIQHQKKDIETILITKKNQIDDASSILGLIVSKSLTKMIETYIIGPQ